MTTVMFTRLVRWTLGFLGGFAAVVLATSMAHGKEGFAGLTQRARTEAGKWQRDARLVQIEISAFGFAFDRGGIPDLTKAGPPGMALFHFFSPATGQAMRITMLLKLTPEQVEFMRARGGSDVQVERLPRHYSPFTLPIPENVVDLDQALAKAQHAGLAAECAGGDPKMSSCTLVQQAELHTYWSGRGEAGFPVWTISFGQHPTTLETVTRQIDAETGSVVTIVDRQPDLFERHRPGAVQVVLSSIGRRFPDIWKAVNTHVIGKDPLFKPYAATLALELRENHAAGGPVAVLEASIMFAKITPSFTWQDLEARMTWSSDSKAILAVGPSIGRSAPEEPKPDTLDWTELPDAEPNLRKLVDLFPKGYHQQYTTWERGCEDVLTGSPSIRETRCGVLVPTTHDTDQIVLWLTRRGNPYWRSAGGPSEAEYPSLVHSGPANSWVWWTRVMRNGQWQYTLLDAATGHSAAVCTAPAEDSSTPPARQPCR